MSHQPLTLRLVEDPASRGAPDALGLIPMGHPLSAMDRVGVPYPLKCPLSRSWQAPVRPVGRDKSTANRQMHRSSSAPLMDKRWLWGPRLCGPECQGGKMPGSQKTTTSLQAFLEICRNYIISVWTPAAMQT